MSNRTLPVVACGVLAASIALGSTVLTPTVASAATTGAAAASATARDAPLVITSKGEYTSGPVNLVSGTAEPGSIILVSTTGDFHLGHATADADGVWNWNFDGSDIGGDFTLRISDGITTIDHVLKDVTERAPLVITSKGEYTTGPVNPVGGTAEPGSFITITTTGGFHLGFVTTDDDGAWNWNFDGSKIGGDYTLRITDGRTTIDHVLKHVQYVEPTDITGAYGSDRTLTLQGIGTPGASIVIRDRSGSPIAHTTVPSHGRFVAKSSTAQPQPVSGDFWVVVQDHELGHSEVRFDFPG